MRGREATATRMEPISVLLCDDTKDILLLLSLEFGFDPAVEVVATAENGLQAIELAGRFRPDVVVLDLAMPVMDGLEALPEIKRVSPETSIIVLSGFDASAMANQALSLGAERYLEKGTTPNEIVRAVKDVGERSRGGGGSSDGGRGTTHFARLRPSGRGRSVFWSVIPGPGLA
jgi:YesN/AraC family two-component response regulator